MEQVGMPQVSVAKNVNAKEAKEEIEKQQKITQAQQVFLNQLKKGCSEEDAFERSIKIATGDYDSDDFECVQTCNASLGKIAKSVTPENLKKWLAVIGVAIDIFEKFKKAQENAAPRPNQNNSNYLDMEV